MPAAFYARTIEKATGELQLLESLRTNRQKRTARGRFVVEGVRNIDAARRVGWPIETVLAPLDLSPSRWAREVIDDTGVEVVGVAPELFDRLTDRVGRPELLLVARIPTRTLADIVLAADSVVTVVDRIASPGNLGTIIRTSDALGASGVVIVGHGASPYDPQAVRASTGSLFAVPVVAVPSVPELAPLLAATTVVATDEHGDVDLADAGVHRDGPVAIVLGNETAGLSRALRDRADVVVRIPIGGTASSLNVAVAHGIVLHDLARRVRG